MALDHCNEQYNAWKLKLMYKIKNIERCQLFRMWFVEMGIQMFFGNPNWNICAYSVFQKILFWMPISRNLYICEFLDLRSKIHIQNSPKRRVIEIRTLRSHRWESKPRVPLSSMISQQLKLNRCFRFTLIKLFTLVSNPRIFAIFFCNFADGLSSTQTEETIRHINSLFSLQF